MIRVILIPGVEVVDHERLLELGVRAHRRRDVLQPVFIRHPVASPWVKKIAFADYDCVIKGLQILCSFHQL